MHTRNGYKIITNAKNMDTFAQNTLIRLQQQAKFVFSKICNVSSRFEMDGYPSLLSLLEVVGPQLLRKERILYRYPSIRSHQDWVNARHSTMEAKALLVFEIQSLFLRLILTRKGRSLKRSPQGTRHVSTKLQVPHIPVMKVCLPSTIL